MKKTAKIIAAALTAALTLSSAASAATFTDISASQYSWCRSYIEDMADKGYITGYDDGTFKPDKEVTNLEAIALFARQMGALKSENEDVLELAHSQYDEVIDGYKLTWGQDEIAFMMYKGALKKSDLDTYIADGQADVPMKRYQAAIIITKAMGGEEEATSKTGVTLTYTDKSDIPSNAIQYVNYVSENGIMEGMENGDFSPLTSVLRSQMAVMLARVSATTDYSFANVHIEEISDDGTSVTVLNEDGEEEVYTISSSTEFKIKGEAVQLKNMITDVDAVLTLSGKTLVCIDTSSDVSDEVVTGQYLGKTLLSGVTTIRITPSGETTQRSFVCADDLTVTYEGSPATLNSINVNDTITVTTSDGKATKIVAEKKTTTVSGATVTALNIGDDGSFTMTVSSADSSVDGQSYPASDSVSVMKDGVYTELSKIYVGDTVNLTLEYGSITKIVATSTTSTVEGTIKEIKIATQPSIIITVNGEDREYTVPSDAKMTRNDEDATLYDFRVGDLVKLVLESSAVTKISTTSIVSEEGSIIGVVQAVNTSYGFLTVLPTGSTTTQTVFYQANKVTVLDKQGATKSISNLKTGSTIYATGNVSNGAFTANVIILTAEAE